MDSKQVTQENFWETLDFILSGEIVCNEHYIILQGDLYEGVKLDFDKFPYNQRLRTKNGQIAVCLNGDVEINGVPFKAADYNVAYSIATKVYERWHAPKKQEKQLQKPSIRSFFKNLFEHKK